MKVKHFKVRNFTSLIDVDLSDLPNLVVLIGKNSSGKSNLIDALALLFTEFGTEMERSVGTEEYLFPNHDIYVEPPPEIAVTVGLTSEECADLFDLEALEEDKFSPIELRLVKQMVATDDGIFWETNEVRFGMAELVKDGEILDIGASIFPDIIGDDWPDGEVFHVSQFLSQLGPLLRSSFDVIHTTESPRVWSDRFTQRPTIIDDAELEELRNLSQSSGRQRQDWLAVTHRYEDLAPNRQRPVAVGSSIEMEESNLSIPIGMTGEGSQAMLRLIDQIERGPQILAIEEPETHLHPAFIKKVGGSLQQAATKGKQLFVCTHSPFLVDQSSLDCFYVVKNEGNGTKVSPMRDIGELRDLLLDMGMRPSDVLFCDAILLVDGLSDEVFFDALSNKIGAPLAERHVKVVKANGKSRGKYKIEFWAEVGREAGVPIYAIFDKDADEEARDAIENCHIPQDRCVILSHGALEDHYPWSALRRALEDLGEEAPEEELAVGKRVPELRNLLSKLAPRNAWKPLLAEAVARAIRAEDAESEMADVVNFFRKIRADLDAR